MFFSSELEASDMFLAPHHLQLSILDRSVTVALGERSRQSVPVTQHLCQRKIGFDSILHLVERKSELSPFTALPRVWRERNPRGKFHARFG